MHSRLLWLLLLLLGTGLLILVISHDQGAVGGLTTDQFGSLVFWVALLLFIGSATITVFRGRLSEALEAALFWIVVAVLLATAYAYRHELKAVSSRVLAEVLPGQAAGRGQVVEIARGRGGEFHVRTQVNGAGMPMVLDTGASAVVLTHDAARHAGLPLEVLSYDVAVETANGRTRAAAVTLDRVAIGGIVERQVPALVAQPGQLKTNLLGMSFLSRLESWEVRGDRLVLRGYP